ncbi:MAG: cytochrome c [Sphingomonas sp.]
MRIGNLALAISAVALAASAASARGGQAATAPAADPAGVIAGRQAGMRMSAALMASIKSAIDRGDDVRPQGFAAGAIVGWAKAIPGMFPEGSFAPPTEALSTVWSDPVGFKGKAENYQIAAGLLAKAAAAGDREGFASAFGQVRGTCAACHDIYKKP